MNTRNLHTALLGSAMVLAAPADSTGSGTSGANANANAGTATPPAAVADSKLYEATAQKRNSKSDADKVVFVIEADDYKSAWQLARKLTAVGDAHFSGKAFTDRTRAQPMKMIPGSYSVQEVKSLQERSRKQEPVSIATLRAQLEERNIKVPKAVDDLMTELEQNGPLTGDGAGVQAGGEGNEQQPGA